VRRLLLAVAIVLLTPAGWSQTHPNMARGFDPEKLYQFHGLDTVNVMTGNLVIALPIGQAYPVSSHLSYGLQLVYNGNSWNYRVDGGAAEALPSRFNNAGLGWQLTMGELVGPNDPLATQTDAAGNWVYVGPDGSERSFYPALHAEEVGKSDYAASNSPAVGGVAGYTRDGSYLRLVRLAPLLVGSVRNGRGDFEDHYRANYRLEFPDGTMHTFQSRDEIVLDRPNVPSGLDEKPLTYRLTRMEDRFGNWVSVAYVDGASPTWTITDSVGRTHTVTLVPQSFYEYRGSPQSRDLVQRVDLAAFGGQTAATYTFTIGDFTPASKPCAEPGGFGPSGQTLDRVTKTRFLYAVNLPDGSSYHVDQYEEVEPHPAGAPIPCSVYAGHLLRWTLPTGGHIEYGMGNRAFPGTKEDGGGVNGEIGPATQRPAAVATRTLIEDLSPGVSRSWSYRSVLMNPGSYQPPDSHSGPYSVAQDMVALTTDPLGRTTASYFHLPLEDPDYGAPYLGMSATDDGPYHLATEVYDGACVAWNAGNRTCSDGMQTLTPKRSSYVRYERDTFYTPDSRRQTDQNRRQVASKSRFYDDPGCPNCATESVSSDFDGLGHYRTVTESSTFPGTPVRVSTTHYNANTNAGTYVPTDPTAPAQSLPADYMVPATAPWLLELFDQRTATQGAETAKERDCFSLTTGLLLRRRTLSGSADGCDQASGECPNDLVTVWSDTNNDGNIDYESDFGGDTQPLGTGLSCSASLGAPKYQRINLWSGGVLASQQWSGASFKSLDLTIDPSTGLPSESYDQARMKTTYLYDTLGRLREEHPPYEAWTETDYDTASRPARASVLRHSLAAGSPPLTESWVYFDGLGRPVQKKTRMPDAVGGLQQWSTAGTSYDLLGRRSRVEVPQFRTSAAWESLSQGSGTLFQYDRFDRPTSVKAPDGSITSTTYQGTRRLTRTVAVATGSDGAGAPTSTAAPTIESYDGYGRLVGVTERSGAGDSEITTSYGYDVGNRLHTVSTSDPLTTQSRTFTYDQRGLLLSEQHPESGLTLYGPSEAQAAYDARGHATRKVVGSQDLRFTYDSAERLTQLQSAGANGVLSSLKDFTYGTANLGACSAIDDCEARNGKLVTATRHNLDPLFGDVPVTETYKYYGRGGRMAERTTDVGSAGGLQGASFVTRRDWNELGLVGTVAYPTTVAAGQDRFVGYTYDQGILTGVNGYGTVTYQPSGLVAAVAHGNGVSETWDPDPQGMARPARIRATNGGQTLWDSGSYAYDGAGNITTIGGRRFRYDQVGRLTYESNPYPEAFYSYDAFGNRTGSTIAHLNGDVFGRVTSTVDVDPHTNRLQGTALYDDAGNLTQWAVDDLFTYDALSMVTTHNAAGRVVHMLYTADDERIAQVERLPGTDGQLHNKTTWTLRAPENQLLRVFTDDATSGSRIWSWTEDEIWRGTSLMANEGPAGTRHYAVDHLGSPRLVTSASGAFIGTEEFSAFGEGGTTGAGTLQFTAHERDWSHGPTGWAETFDYMHARYYTPTMGRFLSVDPVLGRQRAPQSWNRYAYVLNSPTRYIDADGRYVTNCTSSDEQCKADGAAFESARQADLTSKDAAVVAAAQAYGDVGTANGVTVSFGSPGTAGGITKSALQGNADGSLGLTASVMIRSGLTGTELDAAVAHEGQHVLDAQKFVATFTKNATSWDISKNLTAFQTEMNAYRLTNSIFAAAKQSFSMSCAGCTLGGPKPRTAADVDLAIKKILADPNGAYRLTPQDQGRRQFPEWTTPP
jgi:RHS repeat-associated protein